jgi:hypothetical protein
VVVPVIDVEKVPPPDLDTLTAAAGTPGFFPYRVFIDTVPVVMSKDGAKLLKEGLEPWFFMG